MAANLKVQRKPPTQTRSLRLPTALWSLVLVCCEAERTNPSAVMRTLLEQYAERVAGAVIGRG